MAWHRQGDKPLSEPMMVWLPTHICVTQPEWVIIACWWPFCPCRVMEKYGLNCKRGHAIIGFNHGLPCYVKNMALRPQSRQKPRPSTASVFVYLSPSGHVFNIAWQAMIKTHNAVLLTWRGQNEYKQWFYNAHFYLTSFFSTFTAGFFEGCSHPEIRKCTQK